MYPIVALAPDSQIVTATVAPDARIVAWTPGPARAPDLQIVAMDSQPGFPARIRIGPVHHHYDYELHFPSGVYRCGRPSDWGHDGNLLLLFKDSDWPGP